MSLNKDGFEYLSIDETITFISKNYNIALHAQTIRQAIYDNQIQSIKHGKYIYIAKEMVDYYINNVYRINRIFDKAKVLVFANHKGGVGKTISAFNVAAVLEENHHKVLMIDFDPQASLSLNANIDIDNTPSIYIY